MSADRITRTVTFTLDPEVRDSGDSLRIAGYASVFNSQSRDLGFVETIAPGAFKRALADPQTDVILNVGHDNAALLARQSAGSLKLREDEKGLRVEATLPKTSLARDTVELVRTRNLPYMSFAFDLVGGDVHDERRGGELYRTINSVGHLYDVAIVPDPAYLSTTVDARSAAALAAIRRHARPRDAGPYGPGKRPSFFRDLAVVSEAKAGADALKSAGERYESQYLDRAGTHPVHGTLEEAVNRLAEADARAISAVNWDFVSPSGSLGQGYIGELFAVAARTKAVLAAQLPSHELDKALNITVPRFSSGSSVDYVQENQALSDTDPATASQTSNVATIAGYVDASRQDLDQTPGDILDRAIAKDLGGAWAEELERQIINGDGATGEHLLGLLNIAGITTTTYTDGSPTPAKLLAKVGQCYAAAATAYGAALDAVVVHSRRRAWVDTEIGVPFRWPAQVIETCGIPTTLGAGTEDAILTLALAETYLLQTDVRFDVLTEVNSATLGVRFRSYGYAALLAGRQPASIGKVVGTGCIAPVF